MIKLRDLLDEKSKSKAQQRFMGMVHALQKGDIKPGSVSKSVKDAAKDMSKSDAKDFASTKHKGLPKKVKEDYNLDDHPKKKWITQKLSSIDDRIMDVLFKMYKAIYSSEGLDLSAYSASELRSSYQIVMLIDLDKDPMPDAFIFIRGNRLKLLATDGQSLSKSLVMKKVMAMVRSGYNLEASKKMETIMNAKGAPFVDDEKKVKSMVGPKFVEWLGNGYYKRKLKKGGVIVKRMYGKA